MINNIKNNTISEGLAKRKVDALNEIKKLETKNKSLINGQKILLSLFHDLVEAIFNNNNNRSESKNDNVSVNDNDVNDDVNHDVSDDVNDDYEDNDNDDDYYIIK